jgi:hypothetical protein
MKLLEIKPSTRKGKKLMAIFNVGDKKITTHFGSAGMRDYTLINDKSSKFYLPKVKDRLAVKSAYLRRHMKREDWNAPMTAGALSKWILWTEPKLTTAIRNFKRKFKL